MGATLGSTSGTKKNIQPKMGKGNNKTTCEPMRTKTTEGRTQIGSWKIHVVPHLLSATA